MQTEQLATLFGEFPYLHGFSPAEQARLARQARFLESELYRDIDLARCCHLLEVGCGVGAQTEILLRRFPDLRITGIDYSQQQLASARARLLENPLAEGRTELMQMDAGHLAFAPASFDAAFLCWVLEHVPEPEQVLSEVRRVLRPGGRVYATEVMNATFFVSPYSPHLQQYWLAFNDHQLALGGDPFVGVKLGQMPLRQGFRDVRTEVKTWHLDARDPRRRHEVLLYWSELLLSAVEQLLASGRVDQALVAGMQAELAQLAKDPDLVLFYSFCQASAHA
ncbi:class I SAM-dependent methyltransferase [Paludibacterium sp. B53371]|uniref:class I SAM-dependent methyltransferase n=1 Tax=Paludibacterium sp. B53371 TaxID=2806263 RepID=UPI001C05D806|nr:class I SAM-dependent methyltransferase [Paludibacterium sp. B53371]